MRHLHQVDCIRWEQATCLHRKQGWIGLLSQHPIKWVGLNVSSTSLIRKISNSKHYPAEKPPNKISSLESTDTLQS